MFFFNVLAVYLTTCYLIVYFYIKRDEVEKMLISMNNNFFYSSEEGVYEVNMYNFIRGSKIITGVWCLWVPFAVFSVSLVPVVTEG